MKKLKIYPAEARVLQTLYYSPRSLTTNEVADKGGISWATADKYIQNWRKKNIIIKKQVEYSSIKEKKKLKKDTWTIDKESINKIIEEIK